MSKSELRSFHAVATSGGFSAAARELNISQSTLSTQVKELERRYGVELFNRMGKKVTLTYAGTELYQITSRLHQAEKDAQNLLESFKGFHSGMLSIAAVGPFHATDMIVAFKELYPSVDVQVSFGNSRNCYDRVLSFDADIGIIAEIQTDKRAKTLHYNSHEVVIFVNKDHDFADRSSIKLAELEGYDVLRREAGSTTRTAFEDTMERHDVSVNYILELGSREAIWKAVEKGLGMGYVADFEFVQHENLRMIPIEDVKIKTDYHVVFLKERANWRLIRSFVKVMDSLNAK